MLENSILCIIRVWSVICSVRVYISLHCLPIILVKLCFLLSCFCIFDFYTMLPSYRIAMAPFQFSYRIGLLFPLEHIFFGMIFVTERGWNAPIVKVIRGVWIAIDPLRKANGNKSGTIIGYDFEFKWKQKTYNY